LFELIGRNMAPAVAYLAANGASPIMVVLPANHIIKNKVCFRAHLNIAIEAAESSSLGENDIRHFDNHYGR